MALSRRALVLLGLLGCGEAEAAERRSCGPPIEKVVSVALSRAGHPGDEAGSWRRRLYWSSLLPRVAARLGQTRASGEVLDLRAVGSTLDINNYLALRWEVRATWDLSRLVFDQRELSVAARAQQAAGERRQLLERIIRLYYERCHLLINAGKPDREQSLPEALELSRITALLDALTGGLISGANWP